MSEYRIDSVTGDRQELLDRAAQGFCRVLGKYASSQDSLPGLEHYTPQLKELAIVEIIEADLHERVVQAYYLYVGYVNDEEHQPGDEHQVYEEIIPLIVDQLLLDVEEELTPEQIAQIESELIKFIKDPEQKKLRDEIIEAMREDEEVTREDLPIEEEGDDDE